MTASTAKSATKPSPSRMSPGMRRPRGRDACIAATAISAGAGAGIEEAIEEVDGEVDGDEHQGSDEHRALDHRVVAVVDGLDSEPADAGPGEHRRRHDGAAQERAELERRDRQDRDRGVLQRVLGDYDGFAEPLGTR